MRWIQLRRLIPIPHRSRDERFTGIEHVSNWGKVILWSGGIVYGVLSLYLVLYGTFSELGTAFLPLGIGLMGLSFYAKPYKKRLFRIGLVFLLIGIFLSLGRFGQVLF